MTKFEQVMEKCVKQMRSQKIAVNKALLEAICKGLGPSIYKRDALTVAAGQKSELDRIRKNYLIKKLGCKDGPALDRAIDKAIDKIGRSNRNKLRPVFYYLLVRSLKKQSFYV